MALPERCDNSIRAIVSAALLAVFASAMPAAAAECPTPAYAPQAPEQIVDWYVKFIEPARAFAGYPVDPRPAKNVVEAMVETLEGFHHRGVVEPLFFEPLVQRISRSYARAGDFTGLTTAAAEKLYPSGTGTNLDFSALCIDTRRDRFPDDTFAITLSGVNNYNCTHVTLRGLVFTNTLVNGSINGECRPDYPFFRMIIVPVLAGTNTVTFLCGKDAGGCARR